MSNVYKTRPHRVLVNLVFGAGAALFVTFIASIWLKSSVLLLLIALATFAGYVWLVIIGNMIVIETDGDTLTIKKVIKLIPIRFSLQRYGQKPLVPAGIRNARSILPSRAKKKC